MKKTIYVDYANHMTYATKEEIAELIKDYEDCVRTSDTYSEWLEGYYGVVELYEAMREGRTKYIISDIESKVRERALAMIKNDMEAIDIEMEEEE